MPQCPTDTNNECQLHDSTWFCEDVKPGFGLIWGFLAKPMRGQGSLNMTRWRHLPRSCHWVQTHWWWQLGTILRLFFNITYHKVIDVHGRSCPCTRTILFDVWTGSWQFCIYFKNGILNVLFQVISRSIKGSCEPVSRFWESYYNFVIKILRWI